jgi:hypothetical protein
VFIDLRQSTKVDKTISCTVKRIQRFRLLFAQTSDHFSKKLSVVNTIVKFSGIWQASGTIACNFAKLPGICRLTKCDKVPNFRILAF